MDNLPREATVIVGTKAEVLKTLNERYPLVTRDTPWRPGICYSLKDKDGEVVDTFESQIEALDLATNGNYRYGVVMWLVMEYNGSETFDLSGGEPDVTKFNVSLKTQRVEVHEKEIVVEPDGSTKLVDVENNNS